MVDATAVLGVVDDADCDAVLLLDVSIAVEDVDGREMSSATEASGDAVTVGIAVLHFEVLAFAAGFPDGAVLRCFC